MKPEDKLKELRSQGHTVWSISRLNSANQCMYEYYQTYILRQRGISGVYGEVGGIVHDDIESIYKGELEKSDFPDKLEASLIEMELKGIKFPSDDIRRNYTNDVLHFASNFKLLDGKHLLEKLIIFDVDGHYMQGYIDMIQVTDDKQVHIVDWKTSSRFAGAIKLRDAGRQLVMYKLGLEAMSSKVNVNSLKWCMLKYVTVKYLKSEEVINERKCKIDGWVKTIRKQLHKLVVETGISEDDTEKLMNIAVENNNLSNLPKSVQDSYWLKDLIIDGEVSDTHLLVCSVKSPRKYGSKMCSRRKWVLEMREKFEKEMIDNNLDEMEIDILLDDAVKNNDISNLPDYIKDKYWIEDCYVEYEVDEEKIQELKDYVNNTIKLIESKDVNNPDDWKPLNIHNDSFYCNHLCNHRSTCKFLKEYKANLNLQPKAIFDDLDGIL